MKRYPYITINQPIGQFYLISVLASDLYQMVNIETRDLEGNGHQRVLEPGRVKDISDFCRDSDATFPTSIIVSVDDDAAVSILWEEREIVIDETKVFGSVLDGQHRLFGIQNSGKSNEIELPVVLMFDMTEEEKAYVFSIINSKQKPVSSSLIYDLFGVYKQRSPQRSAHEIARALNGEADSPFHNRLKMLGRKTRDQENATISQGTFVKSLLDQVCDKKEQRVNPSQLVSMQKREGWPLRDFYIQEQDDVLYRVILNCYSALKNVFPYCWENPNDFVLWKTTGFGGVMKALPSLVDLGISKKTLNEQFFEECFVSFRTRLEDMNLNLEKGGVLSGGGESMQNKVRDHILIANGLKSDKE